MSEERLKICKIKKSTLKKVLYYVLQGGVQLIELASLFGGVYSIHEGIKGNPLLADSSLFNYVIGLVGLMIAYASHEIDEELDNIYEGEKKSGK